MDRQYSNSKLTHPNDAMTILGRNICPKQKTDRSEMKSFTSNEFVVKIKTNLDLCTQSSKRVIFYVYVCDIYRQLFSRFMSSICKID